MNNLVVISCDELKSIISQTVTDALHKLPKQEQPASHDENDLLTIDEASKLLKKSTITLHNWKKQGIIPYHRISNRIYFKKSELLNSFYAVKGA